MLGIERGLTEGGDTPTAVGGSGRADGTGQRSVPSFQGLGWGPRDTGNATTETKESTATLSNITNARIAPTGIDADAFFEDMLKSGNMFSPTAMIASLRNPVDGSEGSSLVSGEEKDGGNTKSSLER